MLRRLRRWPALLLCAALSLPALGQSDAAQTREQLRQLEKDIQRISREISSASARRDKLQAQLREAELTLGRLQRDIAATRQAMQENRRELQSLGERQAGLEQQQAAQQARIALEMKAAWRMGDRGQLQLLLNQEDPQTLARAMAYYRYFFQARNTALENYRDTLEQLAQVRSGTAAAQAGLAEKEQRLEEQRRNLGVAQDRREQALRELDASIDSKGVRLQQLQANRKELEGLLRAIEEAVVNLQVPQDYQSFSSARGKMAWPVPGKPGNRFGAARGAGDMRWQGVMIPASSGTTVRAIHHGRVVYADWLRGSGLLLILDHGDGYMSLYAHNQSLLRDVGEWVTAGMPIATVGATGGRDSAALYFEVRHQGKPVNPAKWCRG
tara:strand:- start:3986 stop:5134 length:1149 start_codon:yes stop_codon:yes gene_type:complete